MASEGDVIEGANIIRRRTGWREEATGCCLSAPRAALYIRAPSTWRRDRRSPVSLAGQPRRLLDRARARWRRNGAGVHGGRDLARTYGRDQGALARAGGGSLEQAVRPRDSPRRVTPAGEHRSRPDQRGSGGAAVLHDALRRRALAAGPAHRRRPAPDSG